MFEYSAILPTFNRVQALRQTLHSYLELEGLRELVVVDDGSTDGTFSYLSQVANPILRVVRHPKNRGSAEARATGIAAAQSPWILMLEDDCMVPKDYAIRLHAAAIANNADIAGAPWVHTSSDNVKRTVRIRRAQPHPRIGLRTHPGVFPDRDMLTPFMPALVLARKEVLVKLRYDALYRSNAWREETCLFIRAIQLDHQCVLTPSTYSYQIQTFDGGQHRERMRYEWWVIYNNWRFLRMHREFLVSGGYIKSLVREQLWFSFSRMPLMRRKIGARI